MVRLEVGDTDDDIEENPFSYPYQGYEEVRTLKIKSALNRLRWITTGGCAVLEDVQIDPEGVCVQIEDAGPWGTERRTEHFSSRSKKEMQRLVRLAEKIKKKMEG